jgi:transposase InsO family protein
MGVSTSAYYAWVKTPGHTDKTRQKAVLEAKARQLFYDRKQTYGYRRLSDALGKAGMKSGHCQVRHLMARLGLKARYPKRFKVTTDSNHHEAISPNLLNREFTVTEPNKVCTTDITYVWTLEGWLSRSSLICSRGKPLAGRLAATCGLRCVPVPCKWRFGAESQNRACSIGLTVAANTPAMNTVNTCPS